MMEFKHLEAVQEFTDSGQCGRIKLRSCKITWGNSFQVTLLFLTSTLPGKMLWMFYWLVTFTIQFTVNTLYSVVFFFSAGFVFVAFFMYSNFIWSKCAYFKCLAIPSQTYLNCNSLCVQCFKLRLLGVFMRNMTSHVIGSLCGREYLCTTPTNYTVINMHSSFIVINVDELTE